MAQKVGLPVTIEVALVELPGVVSAPIARSAPVGSVELPRAIGKVDPLPAIHGIMTHDVVLAVAVEVPQP